MQIHLFIRKCFLVAAFCVGGTSLVFAQSLNAYFQNDSIKYEIVIRTPSVLDKGMIHGVYFVNMQMDKKIEAGLLKKPFAFWFLKLQDSLSDFAAAVLLSYLYKKEATLIKMVAGDRGKWLRIKEDELSAWAEFFKKRTR